MLDTHLPRAGFLDRDRERDVLDRLIAGVRAGQSRVLVLRGEAGIGKSALLGHLSAAAEGCRIARAAGVESEMELAFAGLHALCSPMLDRLGQLPSPQRDALNIAFGMSAGPAARSLPRRPGGAEPDGRCRRGAAARMRGRRRSMARPCVGADTCVRSSPPAGGAGRIGVRAARVHRRARARRAAGAGGRGAGRRRRRQAAGRDDSRPPRRTRTGSDPGRGRRQPARAAGAASRAIGDRGRGRIRAPRRAATQQPPRAGLRAAAGPVLA